MPWATIDFLTLRRMSGRSMRTGAGRNADSSFLTWTKPSSVTQRV